MSWIMRSKLLPTVLLVFKLRKKWQKRAPSQAIWLSWIDQIKHRQKRFKSTKIPNRRILWTSLWLRYKWTCKRRRQLLWDHQATLNTSLKTTALGSIGTNSLYLDRTLPISSTQTLTIISVLWHKLSTWILKNLIQRKLMTFSKTYRHQAIMLWPWVPLISYRQSM